MHHISFGKTGLQCDEAYSHAILDTAASGNIDLLDAADFYPLGRCHD